MNFHSEHRDFICGVPLIQTDFYVHFRKSEKKMLRPEGLDRTMNDKCGVLIGKGEIYVSLIYPSHVEELTALTLYVRYLHQTNTL